MSNSAARWLGAVAFGLVLAAGFGVVSAFAFPTLAHAQGAPDDGIAAAHEALESWQMAEAREKIAALEADWPADPEVMFLRGQLAFYDGDYPKASTLMTQAITNASDRRAAAMTRTRDLVDSTAEVVADHATLTSDDGRFELRVPAGKDEVLAPFVFEAMGAAYDALSEDFDIEIPTPVRIEVYDRAEDLARVSSLSEEAIKTTGTIALCKYNRVMLTSPKALMRGYGWIDTMVHEFVHMVINQAGRDRVPIWLHEGLAKFSERRWRGGDDERRLPPYSEWLLHKRATDGEIVTFEQMHPSMALLPSAEDASVAYAEVYAAMEWIHERHGVDGLRDVVKSIGEGTEVEEAIAGVVGMSFERWKRLWEAHLTARDRRYTNDEPPDIFEKIAFKKKPSVDIEAPDDEVLIEEEEAREFVHLGDMLYGRERPRAAAIEYRKAAQLIGDTNPVLQTRIGRALLEIGELDAAIDAMRGAIEDGEHYVTLYRYLGEALVEAERWNEAYAALMEAAAINPFDPAVHRNLATVYRAQGMEERAEAAEEAARIVVAPPEAKDPGGGFPLDP